MKALRRHVELLMDREVNARTRSRYYAALNVLFCVLRLFSHLFIFMQTTSRLLLFNAPPACAVLL